MTNTPAKKKPTTTASTAANGKSLFIVESPVKAKTIQKYLSDNYVVTATVGHIADIPESARIDVTNGFTCEYELTESGKKVIAELKKQLKSCQEVILATDADREGEMIAAHVVQFLEPKVPVKRVTFGSVTKNAVTEALRTPRDIDQNLVSAARVRRVLDRLFGFELTGVTRKVIRQNATAGRVQSPGLCLVVERELERLAFVAAEYMDVEIETATTPSFTARLTTVAGRRIATGKDFDDRGQLSTDAMVVDRPTAERIAFNLQSDTWKLTVADISHKPATSNPKPPFDMSSLYQEAENRLGMSTAETKVIANKLHHAGHISYPRTDVRVNSPEVRNKIRHTIISLYGKEALCPFERYATNSKKLAQGAHPAIAPEHLNVTHPKGLSPREQMLYTLIWQRTIASQMIEATGTTTTVKLRSGNPDDMNDWCEFSASGTVYTQPGFRLVYGADDDEPVTLFPTCVVNDVVPVAAAEAKEHHTKAPARFVPASLIKELEERGIGRPSTYESIIAKLKDRFVWSKPGTAALIPTVTGLATYRLLQQGFAPLVDYGFTSELESRLDAIATGDQQEQPLLSDFYFGVDASTGLQTLVSDADSTVNPRDMWALELGTHPESGHLIYARPGRMRNRRFSPYLECDGAFVSIPDETCFEDLTIAEAVRLFGQSGRDSLGDIDGVPVFVKVTSTGSYFQLGTKDNLPTGETK
ncbi:MAG: topoisomerase, partial [Actinomycetota bacterium]